MENQKKTIVEISLAALLIFVLIALEVATKITAPIDYFVHDKIEQITNPELYKSIAVVTTLGGGVIITTLSLLLGLFFIIKKKYHSVVALVVGLAGGALSVEIIKLLMARPRPIPTGIVELSYSFPSGHTLAATVFFGLFIYFFEDNFKTKITEVFFNILVITIIGSVGLSRIYLGVHWVSDVLASIFLAVFWISIGILSQYLSLSRKLKTS